MILFFCLLADFLLIISSFILYKLNTSVFKNTLQVRPCANRWVKKMEERQTCCVALDSDCFADFSRFAHFFSYRECKTCRLVFFSWDFFFRELKWSKIGIIQKQKFDLFGAFPLKISRHLICEIFCIFFPCICIRNISTGQNHQFSHRVKKTYFRVMWELWVR